MGEVMWTFRGESTFCFQVEGTLNHRSVGVECGAQNGPGMNFMGTVIARWLVSKGQIVEDFWWTACLHLTLENHLVVKTNSVHSCLWFNLCFSRIELCPPVTLTINGFLYCLETATMPLFQKVVRIPVLMTTHYYDYLMSTLQSCLCSKKL